MTSELLRLSTALANLPGWASITRSAASGPLGLTWIAWSGLALLAAVIFLLFWPIHKAGAVTHGPRYLLLRWGHSLVWLLMALSFYLRSRDNLDLLGSANQAAFAALLVYVAFLWAVLRR